MSVIAKHRRKIFNGFVVIMVGGVLTVSTTSVIADSGERTQAGKQLIPLLMNDQFVLFPGDKAPYLKNNKLMVPLHTFADTIGAIVTERTYPVVQQNKTMMKSSYKIRPLVSVDEVGGLREGIASAIYGGDMGYDLLAAPEYRAGDLYVPATPILRGLRYSYSYETRTVGRNHTALAVMDPTFDRLLSQVIIRDVHHPAYPPIMSDAPYPLIPTVLTQHQVRLSSGASANRLSFTFEREEGYGERPSSITLSIIAVDKNGKTATSIKELAPNGDLTRTVVTDVPFEAAYVLVRATPNFQSEPVYPFGYTLKSKLSQAVAKFYGRQEMFSDYGLHPVDVRVSAQGIALTVRNFAWNRQPVTNEAFKALKQSIYELVGRSFSLRIVEEARNEQPDVTGTITSIDKSGRITIQPDRLEGEEADSLVWLGTPDDDLYIHSTSHETGLIPSDLKVGMQVSAWISGETLRDTDAVHVQLREIIVQ
ncbi:hypothetical protein [Paenibacillus taihuensis]|uniref:hypothetical protein n=1 Tax=Paenibacillus taihuensis TaxID=1156355 RepID=UPI0011C034BC|nr:hypothetical protein [Paenibacillus taihuensis]